MKKYFVLVECVKRENDERGYCDPITEEQFDDELSARSFYNSINIKTEFDYLCDTDKKDHYLEKSLVAVEYENGEDIGDLHDFIETETAGELI